VRVGDVIPLPPQKSPEELTQMLREAVFAGVAEGARV
jgi:hypothetical protein